jgi:3-phenylpropionate/trans-cinnamate dioxygenase ferredoxin reductase subunit
MRTVAIVGGSLAGLTAARSLREQHFDGRVVVVGAEEHPPYDRPPLSKAFLAGDVGPDDIALVGPADADLDLDWRLGATATALDPARRAVVLDSGEEVTADGVVLATGARARALPGPPLDGVHTLRTLDDAAALRAALVPGSRLVVVGAGLIGAEVASTARALGVEVTVVEAGAAPLAAVLGPAIGAVCAGLHAEHGVRLIAGTPVLGAFGDTRVRGLRLADGRTLPADTVVAGIGALPNVEWLAGSGVAVDGAGVRTDAGGASSVPGIVAAGDCAVAPSAYAGTLLRQEHWTNAVQQPVTAVATLLGRPAPQQAGPPYFWSDQYGTRLQYAGHHDPGDVVEVVEGDLDSRRFVAAYRRGEDTVAVVAMNQPKLFGKWRRRVVPARPATTAA